MKAWIQFALAFALFAAPAAAGQDLEVLQFGGEQVVASEFEAWLVRHHGESHALEFAHWRLVQDATRHAPEGAPNSAEIEQRLRENIEQRIEGAFGGNRDAWIRELETTGSSLLAFTHLHRQLIDYDLRIESLVQARRSFTEPDLIAEWERLYGRDGRTLSLRFLSRRLEYPARKKDESREDVNANRERAEVQALQQGAALVDQLRAGETLEGSRKLWEGRGFSLTGPTTGLDETGMKSDEIQSLYKLGAGEFAAPLLVRGELRLYQLVSETQTPFAEAREEARASLMARPVSTAEADQCVAGLLEASPLTLLPAMSSDETDAQRAVLQLGDRTITHSEYGSWLRRRFGSTLSTRFALERIVEAHAVETGLEVSQAEVDERVQELVALQVQAAHGDVGRWEQKLRGQGLSRAIFERQSALRVRTELLAEKAMVRNRQVTENEVRGEWEEQYGPGGRTLRVRVLLRLVTPPVVPEEASESAIEKLWEEARAGTREELVKLAARVEDGEDFAALARRYSDDELTRENGGLWEASFRSRSWPARVRDEIPGLEVGELSPPLVEGEIGYLFELIADERVPFDDVREDIARQLQGRRPAAIRVAVYMNSILENSRLLVLPGMYR